MNTMGTQLSRAVARRFTLLAGALVITYPATASADTLFLADGANGTEATVRLWSVPSDASAAPAEINDGLTDGGGVESFARAPDGAQIAYAARQDVFGLIQLYWLESAGMFPSSLLSNPFAMTDVTSYQWSSDSTRIAFTEDAISGQRLFVRSIGAADAEFVSGSVQQYAWSPDGSMLAFIRADSNGRRKLALWEDGVLESLWQPEAGTEFQQLTWSPDNLRLVVIARQPGEPWQLFGITTEGKDEVLSAELFPNGGVLAQAISADGLYVAYAAYGLQSGVEGVFTVMTDGTNGTQVAEGDPTEVQLGWSPNASMLAFTLEGELYVDSPLGNGFPGCPAGVVQLSDAGVSPVVAGAHHADNPVFVWKPDSSAIAYTAGQSFDHGLFVRSVPVQPCEGLTTVLAEGTEAVTDYAWPLSGDDLLFEVLTSTATRPYALYRSPELDVPIRRSVNQLEARFTSNDSIVFKAVTREGHTHLYAALPTVVAFMLNLEADVGDFEPD